MERPVKGRQAVFIYINANTKEYISPTKNVSDYFLSKEGQT